MSRFPANQRAAWITGIVSSLGEGLEATWGALHQGRVNVDQKTYAPWMVHPLVPLELDTKFQKRATSARWRHGSASVPTRPVLPCIPPASRTTRKFPGSADMIVAAG